MPAPAADSKLDAEGNIAELGGYLNEIAYFVDCLNQEVEPTVVTPADAREALELVLAEVQSIESGEWVTL